MEEIVTLATKLLEPNLSTILNADIIHAVLKSCDN